jgi:hypothetical protein
MKNRYIFLILFFLGFIISFFVLSNTLVFYDEINVSFNVSDSVSFALGGEDLSFGEVLPGSSSCRFIEIYNNLSSKILFRIIPEDFLVDIFDIESEFFVEPNSFSEVEFCLNVPQDLDFGNYSGKFFIKGYK